MQPVKVTAYLANKLSVSDDWSPAIDGLLIKLMLDEYGLASSDPTAEDIAKNEKFVNDNCPISKGILKDDWYWQCSSPQYLYEAEEVTAIHKRWDQQENHLNWNGKRKNWSTSEGNTKSWTMQIPERVTPQIDWYCIGDPDEILRLLQFCTGIGKKRRTQVSSWFVEDSEDWHLWKNGYLMRPMPERMLDQVPPSFSVRNWAWRPPTHLPENCEKCLMPIGNALKVESVYGCM